MENEVKRRVVAVRKKIKNAIKENHNVQLVVVDYFQIVESSKDERTRQGIIHYIGSELKNIARETNVAIIVPAQLKIEGKKSMQIKNKDNI